MILLGIGEKELVRIILRGRFNVLSSVIFVIDG